MTWLLVISGAALWVSSCIGLWIVAKEWRMAHRHANDATLILNEAIGLNNNAKLRLDEATKMHQQAVDRAQHAASLLDKAKVYAAEIRSQAKRDQRW